MKYKIGTIADQFGIHPQTVRYYEREKLMRSEADKNSGTRYYIARDFKRMASVRRYLLMGFGTREVRRLFLCDTPEEVAREVRAKKRAVFEQIRELNRVIWALDQYEENLHLADARLNRCELTRRPEMYLFVNQTGQAFDFSEEARAQVRAWGRHLDVVDNASVVPRDAFLHPDAPCERRSGFLVSAEAATLFGVPVNGPRVERLPAARCLRTVVCLDGPAEDMRRLFAAALDVLDKDGLAVTGDAVGRMLTVLREGYDEREHRPKATYYEYFIPVSAQDEGEGGKKSNAM